MTRFISALAATLLFAAAVAGPIDAQDASMNFFMTNAGTGQWR